MKSMYVSSYGRFSVILLLLVALVLPACASRGGRTFSEGEVRQAQGVTFGTVSDVTDVQVASDPSGLGAVVGGVAGGILGSMIGGGRGNTLAILGGAAAGAAGGHVLEGQARNYSAAQITVNLDNGTTIVVVQGHDEFFRVGDRVRVLSTGQGSARVQLAR